MTWSVKVIGAGSIGNHLAHACRSQDWNVTIVDTDLAALERTKTDIYPSRYGSWDKDITLAAPSSLEGEAFDLVVVGTPPSTHLTLATSELSSAPPRVLLIEKPLSHPNTNALTSFLALAESSPTRVLVGYNQRLKPHTVKFLELAKSGELGRLIGLESVMLESWDGILKAHFWMKSEMDTYLAYSEKGGGALFEHSHALNLFLYFAHELGHGPVTSVRASMDWVDHPQGRYDRDTTLILELESGLVGTVRQDLHTWPARKSAVASFELGKLTWEMGDAEDVVTLERFGSLSPQAWRFPKTRPDDFLPEIRHIGEILGNPVIPSPIDLEAGSSVMKVALAALESSETGQPSVVST